MLTIKYQAAFKRDYKRIKKRGYDLRLLEDVIALLAQEQELPPCLPGSCPDRRLQRLPRVPHRTGLVAGL